MPLQKSSLPPSNFTTVDKDWVVLKCSEHDAAFQDFDTEEEAIAFAMKMAAGGERDFNDRDYVIMRRMKCIRVHVELDLDRAKELTKKFGGLPNMLIADGDQLNGAVHEVDETPGPANPKSPWRIN